MKSSRISKYDPKGRRFAGLVFALLIGTGLAQCNIDPSALAPLLNPCGEEQMVQIVDDPPDSLHLDPFTLKAATMAGDTLILEVTYGGGCQVHCFSLFMSPASFLESYPVRANLYLRHDGHGDTCKALIHQKLEFDVRPIAEAYRRSYGGLGPIALQIFDFPQAVAVQNLSVLYTPQ